VKKTSVLTLLFIITLFLLCFANSRLAAQNVNRDSLKRIAFIRDSIKQDSLADVAQTIGKAKMDGGRFRLSPLQMEQFKAGKKTPDADLFKPTRATVSDTTLLYDSLYVKTYRLAAYKRALDDQVIIPRCCWGSLGAGGNTAGDGAFSVNVNEEFAQKLLVTESLQLETNGFLASTSVVNYSVLAGKIFKRKFSMFTLSAGLSYVTMTVSPGLFSDTPAIHQSTVGIPVLIQAYLVALQTFGLGINAYANLNSVKTTAGITLSIAIGALATHESKNSVYR